MQSRSTIKTIINTFEEIKGQLSERHLDAMSKTPFFRLFEAIYNERLKAADCKKNEKIILSLTQRFDIEKRTIKLGAEEAGLYADDVQFIFGLVDGTRHIDVYKGRKAEWEFSKLVFSGVADKELSVNLLKSRLAAVFKTDGDVAVEDAVRLLCLIVICSLFFSSSGTSITWGWVEYVEKLDDMKTFDWSEAILNTLVK